MPNIEQLIKRIDDLEREINNLKNASTITYQVEQAFRTRFKMANFASLATSNKNASSENQAVDENGTATYDVLKPPDGFDERVSDGVVKYYPYYL